jgi:hypothetical protein
MGFAGGMRRSELVALGVDDLEAADEDYVARLRRSKTDQEAAGRQVPIVYGTDPGCCPVRAVGAWLSAMGLAEGPLFRADQPSRSGDPSTFDRPVGGPDRQTAHDRPGPRRR